MARAPDERPLLALLGVDETASWDEVRRAFRSAVRASHPDVHIGDPDAERRLKALNAAWESVNTPSKWARYVAQPAMRGSSSRASPTAAPATGRLRVHRQRTGSAGLRRWGIELDGEVVGSIENGSICQLQAEPGLHSIRVFYDWYSSPALTVGLRAGEEVVLGCRQQPSSLRSVLSPRRALVLERLSSHRFA